MCCVLCVVCCVVCRYADVIIPWQEGDNIVAIDLVTEHIKTKLQQHGLRRIYPNLEVMPLTKQVSGCQAGHVALHKLQHMLNGLPQQAVLSTVLGSSAAATVCGIIGTESTHDKPGPRPWVATCALQ